MKKETREETTKVYDIKGGEIKGQTYEDILEEYRKYVGDPNAELPEPVLEHLRLIGKIK